MSIQLYCNFRLLKDQGATGNEVESVIRVTGYVRWLRVMIALGYLLCIALVSWENKMEVVSVSWNK